jgi:hypothetical protein
LLDGVVSGKRFEEVDEKIEEVIDKDDERNSELNTSDFISGVRKLLQEFENEEFGELLRRYSAVSVFKNEFKNLIEGEQKSQILKLPFGTFMGENREELDNLFQRKLNERPNAGDWKPSDDFIKASLVLDGGAMKGSLFDALTLSESTGEFTHTCLICGTEQIKTTNKKPRFCTNNQCPTKFTYSDTLLDEKYKKQIEQEKGDDLKSNSKLSPKFNTIKRGVGFARNQQITFTLDESLPKNINHPDSKAVWSYENGYAPNLSVVKSKSAMRFGVQSKSVVGDFLEESKIGGDLVATVNQLDKNPIFQSDKEGKARLSKDVAERTLLDFIEWLLDNPKLDDYAAYPEGRNFVELSSILINSWKNKTLTKKFRKKGEQPVDYAGARKKDPMNPYGQNYMDSLHLSALQGIRVKGKPFFSELVKQIVLNKKERERLKREVKEGELSPSGKFTIEEAQLRTFQDMKDEFDEVEETTDMETQALREAEKEAEDTPEAKTTASNTGFIRDKEQAIQIAKNPEKFIKANYPSSFYLYKIEIIFRTTKDGELEFKPVQTAMINLFPSMVPSGTGGGVGDKRFKPVGTSLFVPEGAKPRIQVTDKLVKLVNEITDNYQDLEEALG